MDQVSSINEEDENALAEAQCNFGEQIFAFMRGALPSSHVLDLGITPQAMIDAGADRLPLVITQKALRHVAEERKGHGIKPTKLIRLPYLLADPLAIYQSSSEPDGQVIVINLSHEGSSLVVAVHLNKREARREVNAIKSVYSKDSSFGRWSDAGLLLYDGAQKSFRLGSSPVEGLIPSRRESAHES